MNQRRTDQLGAVLQRAIQARLDRGLADPRIQGMITVTSVKVAPDMKSAAIGVSVMPHEKQDLTLHGLKSAARHIRHQVGDDVEIHQMPELIFRLDHSLEKQAGVLDAIAKASEELRRKEALQAQSQAESAPDQPRDAYAPDAPPSPKEGQN